MTDEMLIMRATIDARLAELGADRIATLARRVVWVDAGDLVRVAREDRRVRNLDAEIGYLTNERAKWAGSVLQVYIDRCWA